MISVSAFRAKGLRSLIDTDFIELKPITVLVGRNSAGKSTFARIFPLLRQSSEATKKGPLLWWGRLVDFGSFDEAVSRYTQDKTVEFSFKLAFSDKDLTTTTRRPTGRLSLLRALQGGELTVSLQFEKSEEGTYTSSISIELFDFKCVIAIDAAGMVQTITTPTYTWKPSISTAGYAPQDKLVPNVTFYRARQGETVTWEEHDPFRGDLHSAIGFFVHGKTGANRIATIENQIPIGPRVAIFNELRRLANPPSLRDMLQQYGPESRMFERLCDIYMVSRIDVLINLISSALDGFSRDVVYLEPLRATAQRHYRQQDLAVGEIDSKGANIAMYLDSLTSYQQSAFRDWTSKHFGIAVQPKKEGGHVSLTLTHGEGGHATNLADMGFGFSQMLPIAAQLWAASAAENKLPYQRNVRQPLIVIEQPELHLHPEFQSKLADVFAAVIGNGESHSDASAVRPSRIPIIAETHSASLINRLGALIADNKISRKDVQVVLFEQPDPTSPTKIRVAEYDEEGVLQNWPFGFFEPNAAIS